MPWVQPWVNAHYGSDNLFRHVAGLCVKIVVEVGISALAASLLLIPVGYAAHISTALSYSDAAGLWVLAVGYIAQNEYCVLTSE